ncbi:hypothetical protein [Avibacterium endocarditidis]|uniref:hypothetical protein n=1 Tax=Avibacterium endocarditidis TaxID=380674 RepID=UPI0011B700C7|nr:hypothetical protein [Avibacterium endocarditidis]
MMELVCIKKDFGLMLVINTVIDLTIPASNGINIEINKNYEFLPPPFGKYGQAQSNKQAVNEQGEKLYIDSQGNQTTASRDSSGKENKAKLAEGLDSLTGNLSVGFGYEKESQSSITKSGINTAILN